MYMEKKQQQKKNRRTKHMIGLLWSVVPLRSPFTRCTCCPCPDADGNRQEKYGLQWTYSGPRFWAASSTERTFTMLQFKECMVWQVFRWRFPQKPYQFPKLWPPVRLCLANEECHFFSGRKREQKRKWGERNKKQKTPPVSVPDDLYLHISTGWSQTVSGLKPVIRINIISV